MALLYGRTIIDSLHERIGEQRPMEGPPATEERTIWCKNPEANFRCTVTVQVTPAQTANHRYVPAGWARIIGSHGNRDGGGVAGVFRGGPEFNYDIYAFQAGLDVYRHYGADGSRDHVGVYGAVGRLTGDVRHINGIKAGTNTIDAQSVGAYWTHFGPSGWYIDGVVQATWYDAEADSNRLFKLRRKAVGYAASLEAGYPVALGGGWIIEPQAQLIYQTIPTRTGDDGAAIVRFSNVDSLAGRLGARLAKDWLMGETTASQATPGLLTTWLKASVWNEFLGSPRTSFSSAAGFVPFRSDLGGYWAEVKVGVDARFNANVALFASAGYSVGLERGSQAYDGKIGIKVAW